jgi:hypothetical protein
VRKQNWRKKAIRVGKWGFQDDRKERKNKEGKEKKIEKGKNEYRKRNDCLELYD